MTALPFALLAELTHRCPLACLYCSNPIELRPAAGELTTAEWRSVFAQAAALGVLHLHLSGGEPAARADLVALVAAAAGHGLYTNLITSGLGLSARRVDLLAAAGLDHVQLSLQDVDEAAAAAQCGRDGAHARKLQVAGWVTAAGLALTINVVCHRGNIERIDALIALALVLGARRIEVATVQLHGWAAANAARLLPTRDQNRRAAACVAAARTRLAGEIVIDYVPADYHARHPKACMEGWGRTGLVVDPHGAVLPCHAAATIPGLDFDSVRDRPLADIWHHGRAFNEFRGVGWMQEPCRSCERRDLDFGGCRCQALALAGDAAATDPVCHRSPLRPRVDALVAELLSAGDGRPAWRARA